MMTNETKLTWSDKQVAVFDWVENGTGNAIIEAVAGSGKTTTLVEAIKRFPAGTKVAICAYNKKMGDELKAKTASIPGVDAGTLHSFGFRALTRVRGRNVKVEANKVSKIVFAMVDTTHPKMKKALSFVLKLVGLAKDSGIGFFTPINERSAWQNIIDHHDLSVENEVEVTYDEIIDFAIEVLKVSNNDTMTIDFADMIYHVLLHGIPVFQYDAVLIDEAQDTNPTRRALASKMLKSGGRLIAVGDPRQAIFGFTGADNDALQQIRDAFAAVTLPLTVSYRCAQSVVNHARKFVSHIEAAETAPAGLVSSANYADFVAKGSELANTDAILCRKTAPLVDLAFTFIRNGIACRIEGKDIGSQLVTLIRKWRVTSLNALSTRLETYLERETQKAMSKGAEAKAEQIADRVETLQVLIERANERKLNVEGLITMITDMFGDSAFAPKKLLTLSTIHKAKGLEWDRVFLLGRSEFQPSKYARKQWQIEQEINLIYVAITRAKRELVEVNNMPKRSFKKTF